MNAIVSNSLTGCLYAVGVAADAYLIWMGIRSTIEDRRRGRSRCSRAGAAPCAAICLAAATPAAFAQPAPGVSTAPLTISTDRPSFSDGTGIAPPWHFQLETGYTFTHRDRDGAEADRHNGPEMLGRVGILEDRLEFRVIWSGYVDVKVDSGGSESRANGLSDVTVGLKLKLFNQGEIAGWTPRLALGAQTTLGAGGAEVSTQEQEPALKLLWSYDLGACWGEKWAGWSCGGNFNIAWPASGEGTDRFEQFQASAYVNAPLFEGCTGFAEYFALSTSSDGGGAAHYVDLGAVYLLAPGVQVDARVGFGLNREADNAFAGVGLSVLF